MLINGNYYLPWTYKMESKEFNKKFSHGISIIIAGAAGQGIDTITQVIAETAKRRGRLNCQSFR